jgi:predicted dehydrogenase
MKINKLKGVCVGVGYFSQFHYEAWARIPEAHITAICDLREQEAQDTANNWGVDRVYTDFEAMLDTERPAFVDIITPPDSHLNLVRQAAKRGIHIICQKPLAPTMKEAIEIVETAQHYNVRLMIHENWRFQPWYREIKKLLDDNAIGEELFYAHFRMRMGDGWKESAYLERQPYFRLMPRLLIYETGIHFIDTFRYLFGEVKEVNAQIRKLNPVIQGEDWALVNFTFESDQVAIWDANRYNESSQNNSRYTFGEMVIDGSEGSLRLYTDGKLTIQPLGKGERKIPYHPSANSFAGDSVYNTQVHFITSLLQETEFEFSSKEYVQNILIQEAIYQSAASKKTIAVESRYFNNK